MGASHRGNRLSPGLPIGCVCDTTDAQKEARQTAVESGIPNGNALLAAQAFQHESDLVFRRKVSPCRATDVLDDLGRRLFLRSRFQRDPAPNNYPLGGLSHPS
jgi:hypothetical protein